MRDPTEGWDSAGPAFHHPGPWSFPSGYVNKGERLEDAAEREVQEETALSVQIERLINVYSEPNNPVVLVVYEARVLRGSPRAGAEMSELRVFPPGELPSMAFAHDQEIVADWQALATPLSR